jgi:peptidoglycan/LPS O-acetylase OafA/YrhL
VSNEPGLELSPVHTKLTPQSHYRRDIQGLRALAVVLVVFYHAGLSIPNVVQVGGGFIGVDMFFVISGFVVGGVLLREIDSHQRIRVKRFFARRARRLLPALALMLGVTLVVSFFVVPLNVADVVGLSALGAALFSANFVLYQQATDYFAASSGLNPLLHTWSLSVEEQFYFVLVLIFTLGVVVARRTGRNPKTLLIGLAAILLVVSFVYSLYEITQNEALAFFSPFSRAWEFLAGVLLVAAWGKIERNSVVLKLAPLALVLGLGLVGYAALFFDGATVFPGSAALIPVLGTLLLIIAGARTTSGRLRWVLDNPLVVFIGNLSYGWYLWHWPAIVFARYLAPEIAHVELFAAVAALIPAWLSYRFIEKTSSPHDPGSPRALVRVASVGIALPAVVAMVFLNLEARSFQQLDGEDPLLALIDSNQEATQAAQVDVVAALDNADIALVGDSHAGILGIGLTQSFAEEGALVGAKARGDCLLLVGYSTGPTPRHCVEWQEKVLLKALTSRASTVILHGYAPGYLTGFKRGQAQDIEIYDSEGMRAETVEEALSFYAAGLEGTVSLFVESGKKVLIVSSVPDFSQPLLLSQAASFPTIYEVVTGQGQSFQPEAVQKIPLVESQARNAPMLAIETSIATRYPGVGVLDLSPLICADDVCAPWKEGELLYWDFDHITLEHAYQLAPAVVAAVDQLPPLGR